MKPVVECCAPLLDEPLTSPTAAQLAGWFGVLADPTRLRLLSLIAAAGEACAACDLVEPPPRFGVGRERETGTLGVLPTGPRSAFGPRPSTRDLIHSDNRQALLRP